MAVSEQTPVNSSTGNGVTTVFPYTFKILAAADLEVTVDGVVKTLTTHYSVSGVGDDAGGDVTFVTAPANGTAVIRRRNMALTRTTDYQDQGELPAAVLNADQDAPVLMAQQLQEQIDRSIKAPLGETGADLTLPSAADRANKTLVFDDDGNITVAATPESAQAAVDEALVHRNAAAVSAAAAATAETNAETAETNAETAAAAAAASEAASYGNAPIFTGTRPAATTAGLAAVASTELFKTRQQYDNGVDVWLDNAGTAVWQEQQPFGLGETAYQFKAIEGATIDPPEVVPDLDYDCLDLTHDGRVIPNRSAATAPNKNLNPLSTGEIRKIVGSDTPITARAATGPGGATTAAEFTFAGANVNVDVIHLISATVLPAGTYSVVVALRSKTGMGAQNIQFWESVGGTTQISNVQEAAWADYTFNITVAAAASHSVRLRSQAAGSAFWIDRIRVFEGDGNSVPAWANEPYGHVKNVNSPRGALVRYGMQLDLTNSVIPTGIIPLSTFPSSTTVTEVAWIVVASIDDTAQDNIAPILTGDVGVSGGFSTTALMIGTGNSSPESARNNGAIVISPSALEFSRINPRGEGIQSWGAIVNTTRTRKFFRGLRFYDNYLQAGIASTNTPTLGFGGQNSSSRFRGKWLMAKAWINRSMTVTQMQDEMEKMEQRVQARGLAMGSFRDVLFADGDSRSWNSNAAPNGPGWNHILADHEYFGSGKTSLKCFTLAWGGTTLGFPSDTAPPAVTYVNSSMYSRLPEILERIEEAHALGLRILYTYQVDVNDAARIKSDVAAYVTAEKAILALIKAALDAGPNGSELFVVNCTPIHTDAAFETPRAALNVARALYPSQGVCEGILDFAADATLGTYSGTTAPAGYIDTVHYNGAGGAIAAGIAKTALTAYRLY